MWGLSSVSFMKDSDFKYDAIPSAEIEDRDYLSNNEYLEDKDSFVDIPHRPTVRRTPFQNCLLFSSPLVLLMVVTWVLVSISSTDREVSIVKSLKASKAAATVTTTATSTAGDVPPVVPIITPPSSSSSTTKSAPPKSIAKDPKSRFHREEGSNCSSCPTTFTTGYCMDTTTPVLGGLDVVHFYQHTSEKERGTSFQAGSEAITTVYQGYTLRFVSVGNLHLFLTSPETYLPQFGGFCAWGVAGEYCPDYPWSESCLGPSGNWELGYKYEGKLYFFYESGAVSKFFADPDTYVQKGAERWASWFGGTGKTVISTNCYVKPTSAST